MVIKKNIMIKLLVKGVVKKLVMCLFCQCVVSSGDIVLKLMVFGIEVFIVDVVVDGVEEVKLGVMCDVIVGMLIKELVVLLCDLFK